MNKTFYILLALVFFSCSKKERKISDKVNTEHTYAVLTASYKLGPLKNKIDINSDLLNEFNLDSIIFHDSIIKVAVGIENCDSQSMYIVYKPQINLNKIIHNGKCFKIGEFDDNPDGINYWADSKAMQLFFSENLSSFGIQSYDTYFLTGYKIANKCDYLFYQRFGVCVGSDFMCMSIDKRGNIIDNIFLTGGSEYDGHYRTTILKKQNDSTFIQVEQNGDDYTNPKKGKFWQYDITKTEIIFHSNGIIDTKYLSSDSIPKPAKKIGEPL